jgi:hypothetical protein
MTVGAFPAVPAGDRSCAGMVAIEAEPAAVVAVVGAVVEFVEGLVVEVVEELVHPASTRADAKSVMSDKVRKRDIKVILSGDKPDPPRETGSVAQTVVGQRAFYMPRGLAGSSSEAAGRTLTCRTIRRSVPIVD